MAIFILLVLLGLIAFHVRVRYDRIGRVAVNVPGPFAFPIFGNIFSFDISSGEKLWQKVRNISNEYYPVTRLWTPMHVVFSIRHPDDMQVLLSSQKTIEKGFAYDYFRPWLREGLLLSTEAAMGIALDRLEEKELNMVLKATHKMGDIVTYSTSIFTRLGFAVNAISENMSRPEALSVLHDFTNKIVKERREYHERTEYKYLQNLTDDVADEDDVYVVRKRRLAFLDLLLAAERGGLIDDVGINEEVNTFIFGGHDTMGSGITYILLLLAEHKEAQDKARAEITEILNKTGGKIGMKEVGEFHYLERCIKEALRLFPPVHTIFRQVSDDIQLKHLFLTKGAELVLHFFDLHRDSNFWPEPEKYDPDRFLFENAKGRHPFAYLPFSAGPRNCVGQRFAMLELKISMGLILYNFYLEPVDRIQNTEISAGLVLQPSRPIHVKFVQIERRA